jgi:hypothetical protein
MARAKAIVTPTGTVSGFVALETPSTKFDPDGTYSCQVDFVGADAKAMKTTIDKLMTASLENGAQRGVTRAANAPYTIADKVLTVKFKQKAVIKAKDGRVFNKEVKLFDSKGKPVTSELGIGCGSEIKVAYTNYAWAVAALGCGVSLQPEFVQVIKLVKYQGSGDSNPFGVEDGFEDEGAPFGNEEATKEAPVADVEDDDDDF